VWRVKYRIAGKERVFAAGISRNHFSRRAPPQLPTFSADNIRASGRQQDH